MVETRPANATRHPGVHDLPQQLPAEVRQARRQAKKTKKKTKEDEAQRKAADREESYREVAEYEDNLARQTRTRAAAKKTGAQPEKGAPLEAKSKPAAKGKGKATEANKKTRKGRNTRASKEKTDTQDVDEANHVDEAGGNASSALSEVPSDIEVPQVAQVEEDEDEVLAEPSADEASEVELEKKKDKPSKTALREKIQTMRKEVPPVDVIAQTPKPGGSRVPINTGGNSSCYLPITMRLLLTEIVLHYHNVLTSLRDISTPRYFDDFTNKVDNAAWNLRNRTGSRSQSSRTSSTATSGTATSSLTASSAISTNSRAPGKRTSRGQPKLPPPSVVNEEESDSEIQAPAKKIKPTPSLSRKAGSNAEVNGTQARFKAPATKLPNASTRLSRILEDDSPIFTGFKPRLTAVNTTSSTTTTSKNVVFKMPSPPAVPTRARGGQSGPSQPMAASSVFVKKPLAGPPTAEQDEDIDMDQEVPLRRLQQSKGVRIRFDSDDDIEEPQERLRQSKGARIRSDDDSEDERQERPKQTKGVHINFTDDKDDFEDEYRPRYDFGDPQNPVTGHGRPGTMGYISPYTPRPKPYKLHKTSDPLNDLEEEVEQQAVASSPIKRGSRVPATAVLDFDNDSEEQDQVEADLVEQLHEHEDYPDPSQLHYDFEMAHIADTWDDAFVPEGDDKEGRISRDDEDEEENDDEDEENDDDDDDEQQQQQQQRQQRQQRQVNEHEVEEVEEVEEVAVTRRKKTKEGEKSKKSKDSDNGEKGSN
ncbi:hypothetical protein CERSUDRAFT_98005, partial [Gelatoporia subvermispora B]